MIGWFAVTYTLAVAVPLEHLVANKWKSSALVALLASIVPSSLFERTAACQSDAVPAPTAAAPATRPAPSPPKAFGVGSKAPALSVERWIKGDPVTEFEPGKVYVIEFWATWCGPCVAGIGHLTTLQEEYRDQGLTIVGCTNYDPKNSLALVQAMVALRGDGMNYTVAWDKGRSTYSTYMTAAQQKYIPTSFVIGKDGLIEYIGGPKTLDLVVPKVIAGTWNHAAGVAEVREAEKTIESITTLGKTDPKAAIEQFKEFESRWPGFADQFLLAKFELETKTGAVSAKATHERLVERSVKQKDFLALRTLAARWLAHKTEADALDNALRIIQAANEASAHRDVPALRIEAKIREARGEMDEAISMMKQALALADDLTKPRIEGEIERMQESASDTKTR